MATAKAGAPPCGLIAALLPPWLGEQRGR